MGEKSIYTILKSPILSEKATKLATQNKYVFWVNNNANKIEIKRAVESFYKVKVIDVAIMNVKGKKKRIRWGQEGKKSDWKKAIVTLKAGEQISFT